MTYRMTSNDDDTYTTELSYEDSTGIKFDKSVGTTDPVGVIEELTYEIMLLQLAKLDEENEEEDYYEDEADEEVDDYVLYLEEVISDLIDENRSLKQDMDILQRRADDAVKDSNDTKKHNDGFALDDLLNNSKKSIEELEKLVKDFYRSYR